MSCHDWSRLTAHRLDSDLSEPAQWPAAMRHLESCSECRREALALDPTLAFRGAAEWTPAPADIEVIRLGVDTLRRTGALAATRTPGKVDPRRRGARGRVASALLFAAILALQAQGTARTHLDPGDFGAVAHDARLDQQAGPTAPAIEGLDRPQARVYEWGADDLSVVMVVDESLDV